MRLPVDSEFPDCIVRHYPSDRMTVPIENADIVTVLFPVFGIIAFASQRICLPINDCIYKVIRNIDVNEPESRILRHFTPALMRYEIRFYEISGRFKPETVLQGINLHDSSPLCPDDHLPAIRGDRRDSIIVDDETFVPVRYRIAPAVPDDIASCIFHRYPVESARVLLWANDPENDFPACRRNRYRLPEPGRQLHSLVSDADRTVGNQFSYFHRDFLILLQIYNPHCPFFPVRPQIQQ